MLRQLVLLAVLSGVSGEPLRRRSIVSSTVKTTHSLPLLDARRTTMPSELNAATAVPAAVPLSIYHARLQLLLSAAIYGTYTVIIRALNTVGGEPLPAVFVTCVRYFFLMFMAFGQKAWRARQARIADAGSAAATASRSPPAPFDVKLWVAATELGVWTVATCLLAIYGIGRVPAVMAEILSSTVHVFVPIVTLVLVGGTSFGVFTWSGCLVAFAAAVISCVADGGVSGSGSGGGGGHDLVGQAALIASAFGFAVFRVRTQQQLKHHKAEALNLARMVCMGGISVLLLLVDVLFGGGSATTIKRLHHVLPMQWVLMALSVFLSAFIASALSFSALRVIPAANAQPFMALQPLFCAVSVLCALSWKHRRWWKPSTAPHPSLLTPSTPPHTLTIPLHAPLYCCTARAYRRGRLSC